ncbi:MAG: hypothetical protein GY727_00580 [Gammaproteobacteria bacterium]|nr:hypothetical protein [Gammaproteobacteria bacterium]
MAHQLIKLRPTSVNLDVPPAELPMEEWSSGLNFTFRDGFAVRVAGWNKLFPDTSDTPIWTINARQTAGSNYWITAQPNGIFVTDTGAWKDITPAGYVWNGAPDAWTGGLLNGMPFMNNGVMPPFYWDLDFTTPTVCQTLPGWPADTLCKAMRSYKYHLIAMHITVGLNDFPDQIYNSSAAAPGLMPDSWTPTAANDAGDNVLAATRGAVIDGAKLRGQFLLYKDHSVYRANYIGGTFVFAYEKFLGNTGVLARNCIVDIEGEHAFFSDGDILRTDGQNVKSIIDRRFKRNLFEQISSEHYKNSFVVENRSHNEVYFCYPETDNIYPNMAVAWDYARDQVSLREIGATPYMTAGTVAYFDPDDSWDAQTDSWEVMTRVWGQTEFQAADDGIVMLQESKDNIFRFDNTEFEDGSAIDGHMEKTYIDFGVPEQVKTVMRVWPRTTSTKENLTIKIRAGGSHTPDRAIEWSDWVDYKPSTLTPTEENDFVSLFATGRYLSFQFQVAGDTSYIFALLGFDVELAPRGRF